MSNKKNREFFDSASLNLQTYRHNFNALMDIALSEFEYDNLPDTMNRRYIEMALFSEGHAVLFKDEDIGFLGLRCAFGPGLNVYQDPTERTAVAGNGYRASLDESNSVIIYNNNLRCPTIMDLSMFARRLTEIDRAIDVNAKAQKTPILIRCDQTERLTMLNLYKEYDGNSPVIFGDKGLNTKGFEVLQTGAPYVADKLFSLRTDIWNEAMTYLGIPNITKTKKERLIKDEVERSQGGTIASRFSRLEARETAIEAFNKMFGLNIKVHFREDDTYCPDREKEKGDEMSE